ncbi:GNAT family N-acetyltransferase [Corynebacterium heidelbergense]|uniref:GNAT family N-acetyltransferase n=1 Tax=Corynebacterium heidelbergense TaxID=2055947 RepID=A0A364V596_9CORY|nr:GNAT family N-acetyltransferase [Corynebacterium heidelbergense]RAV31813.1 GNAT family N-acetyltransferase [Corynebacterium heidelbergense]
MPLANTAARLILRPPEQRDETAVRGLFAELRQENFDFLALNRDPTAADWDWSAVIDHLRRIADGKDLPPGIVRADFLLAEVDGQVVGRSSIRYGLTDFLRREGGHIGYAVGPRFRRRGYATEILRQSVDRLRANGIGKVLVTCDATNTASATVIEKCGGQLADVVPSTRGKLVRRYWIDADA